MPSPERQITHASYNHFLTNTGVWSPDGRWLVYDIRSDTPGPGFDGERIEMVNVQTGEVRVLYQAKNGAHCGVVTFHPREWKVVFIAGPENPTPDWEYSFWHREGLIVDVNRPGHSARLDARDVTPPFTPGALRGGSHVHIWDPAGEWVSFTYEDHVLAHFKEATETNDINLRNVGISVPGHPVEVRKDHPRNQSSDYFSVVVTRTTANPRPASEQISKAFEEGWIGREGYLRTDGRRQRRALAFQGNVLTAKNETISEVFVVDLPDDVTLPGDGPLQGTETRMPSPPKGTVQRRLTFTADRNFPGIQGPRHWLRSSPDGNQIAFLMKDDAGVVQLWTISPNGGQPRQVTHNDWPIASTFTWSPNGKWIAHVMDNSVCVTDVSAGKTTRLTPRAEDASAPRAEACVFSPDGKRIAYLRKMGVVNQVFVVGL
jgi:Protein of unknown function (DUF3748)/Dipeptidyl peptidase IV (DPP IV) N-terminal region/WD40-like Beta Propeller Repeat